MRTMRSRWYRRDVPEDQLDAEGRRRPDGRVEHETAHVADDAIPCANLPEHTVAFPGNQGEDLAGECGPGCRFSDALRIPLVDGWRLGLCEMNRTAFSHHDNTKAGLLPRHAGVSRTKRRADL